MHQREIVTVRIACLSRSQFVFGWNLCPRNAPRGPGSDTKKPEHIGLFGAGLDGPARRGGGGDGRRLHAQDGRGAQAGFPGDAAERIPHPSQQRHREVLQQEVRCGAPLPRCVATPAGHRSPPSAPRAFPGFFGTADRRACVLLTVRHGPSAARRCVGSWWRARLALRPHAAGYGFIEQLDDPTGGDVFVHYREIETDGSFVGQKELVKGMEVRRQRCHQPSASDLRHHSAAVAAAQSRRRRRRRRRRPLCGCRR